MFSIGHYSHLAAVIVDLDTLMSCPAASIKMHSLRIESRADALLVMAAASLGFISVLNGKPKLLTIEHGTTFVWDRPLHNTPLRDSWGTWSHSSMDRDGLRVAHDDSGRTRKWLSLCTQDGRSLWVFHYQDPSADTTLMSPSNHESFEPFIHEPRLIHHLEELSCQWEITNKCATPGCDKILRDSFDREAHKRVHTRDRPSYECQHCGSRFTQDSARLSHERKMHRPDHSHERKMHGPDQGSVLGIAREGHVCKQCGRFISGGKGRLNSHVKRHTSVRSHVCHLCSKHFKVWKDLRAHIDRHGGGKFVCGGCGKRMAQNRTLKSHRCPLSTGNEASTSAPRREELQEDCSLGKGRWKDGDYTMVASYLIPPKDAPVMVLDSDQVGEMPMKMSDERTKLDQKENEDHDGRQGEQINNEDNYFDWLSWISYHNIWEPEDDDHWGNQLLSLDQEWQLNIAGVSWAT